MAVIYMLLTIKLKLKEKWHLAYRLVLLLVIKQKINEEFEIVFKFLLGKMLFLMNQSFDI